MDSRDMTLDCQEQQIRFTAGEKQRARKQGAGNASRHTANTVVIEPPAQLVEEATEGEVARFVCMRNWCKRHERRWAQYTSWGSEYVVMESE